MKNKFDVRDHWLWGVALIALMIVVLPGAPSYAASKDLIKKMATYLGIPEPGQETSRVKTVGSGVTMPIPPATKLPTLQRLPEVKLFAQPTPGTGSNALRSLDKFQKSLDVEKLKRLVE